jgi:hypothetical protein
MTTSPNSSAEAWEHTGRGTWRRPWVGGFMIAWADGRWCILGDLGTIFRKGRASGKVAAMEAADLAIAEMERKG